MPDYIATMRIYFKGQALAHAYVTFHFITEMKGVWECDYGAVMGNDIAPPFTGIWKKEWRVGVCYWRLAETNDPGYTNDLINMKNAPTGPVSDNSEGLYSTKSGNINKYDEDHKWHVIE